MALTDRLNIVADCFPDPHGAPDLDKLESANRELFERIRISGRFPINGKVRMLDIGSGNEGSDFVNRYGLVFPNTKIVYIDSFLDFLRELDKPTKVCADATQLSFQDNSFDIAYAGHIVSAGVLKNHWQSQNASYRIAKDAFRVLKQGGLFVFTCGDECDDAQTIVNLSEIGFNELKHLQRIKWLYGAPTDTYAVRKTP